MNVDTALNIARDPLATRWEQTEVGHVLADEVLQLRGEVAEHERRSTLGGIPPVVDLTWGNQVHAGGVHADYRGRL
jgi:hypothetical protein